MTESLGWTETFALLYLWSCLQRRLRQATSYSKLLQITWSDLMLDWCLRESTSHRVSVVYHSYGGMVDMWHRNIGWSIWALIYSIAGQRPDGHHHRRIQQEEVVWSVMSSWVFFPTCQVRVVRFYVSCLLLLSSPLLLLLVVLLVLLVQLRPAIHSVLCRTSTTTIHAQCSLPDLNREYPCQVFPAGPQPWPSTPSVPCRTSTTSIHAQCSLPDLNHDHPRPVFPAGPQPRVSMPSVPCRTSCRKIWDKVCAEESYKDRMPEDLPDRMPEDMPEDMPDRMPNRMSEDMSDRMPEDLPDNMPEDMPDRMPEDLPDRMPENMPGDMPDRYARRYTRRYAR